jgi:hypothetical protein
MLMVDIVIGEKLNKTHKWVETIEVPSRAVASVYGRDIVRKWNETLRPGDTVRVFWCVVPERPSTPKKKKEATNAPTDTPPQSFS